MQLLFLPVLPANAKEQHYNFSFFLSDPPPPLSNPLYGSPTWFHTDIHMQQGSWDEESKSCCFKFFG